MSRKLPEEHECDHILIVEGHSDLLFYVAFLHHIHRLSGVFFKSFSGKSKILNRVLLSDFITPKMLAEKKSIGIILDADENPNGTVQSAKDCFKVVAGIDLEEGTWQEREGFARLGFFVAPNKDTKGEIETLVWNAFPQSGQNDGMKQAVNEYLERMKALGWETHSPDKGRIGAYLAAAYDEDPRLGPGAREKKFDFDSAGFARLRTFFEVLPQSIQTV